MTEEKTRLTISVADRVFERPVETDPDMQDQDTWRMSSPIPGAIIINTWELYHLQKIVLAATETGHYQIFRSVDMKRFARVHDHSSEIFNIYYIDEGVAVFSATDGWWDSGDTGLNWDYLDDGVGARAAAVLPYDDADWLIFAYGIDKKVYARHYPTGTWAEVYDAAAVWSGKWWPAIAGGVAGVLVGVGPYLVRTDTLGSSWQIVQDFGDRVIKSIIVSSRSNMPVYLIETDLDGKSEMWWTYDVGDSVTLNETRFDVVDDAQAVIPTGQGAEVPTFAVFGRRTPESDRQHKIIEG